MLPNVSDLDRGRILGNFEDYSNLIKLGEILNTVHALGGYPVEPCDLDVSERHLHAVSAAARLSTKPSIWIRYRQRENVRCHRNC